MIKHSKISDHKFKKGEFITPWNSLPQKEELEDDKSWTYGRMPEYLWIGLIFQKFGREDGFKILHNIILELHKLAPTLTTIRFSQILSLDIEIQKKFYQYIINIGAQEALNPLTIHFTYSIAPIFSNYFYISKYSITERKDSLLSAMQKIMDHQSFDSTDIRFIVLCFGVNLGKVHLPKEEIDLLNMYPLTSHDDEIMRRIRPTIRVLEMMILTYENANSEYLQNFWRNISEMTECTPFIIKYPEEDRNVTMYMEKLYEIFVYLTKLFTTIEPLDEKMNVLLGIATYSYKRFKEIYDYNLYNSISGRGCVRILIENYIMMKYLIKNETSHDNIWHEYQLYGLGQYKLVLSRYREKETLIGSHIDQDYLEILVNEFKNEEFINIDTKYFNKHSIRDKAENVDEKDLYGLYYDYDSSYEHALWGAIRESSLLKCDNPAHNYHCVPDVGDEIKLKTVLPDCVMVMNKIIQYLNELYGIPEQIFNEVINFEKQLIIK